MKILYLLTQDLESPSGLGRYAPIARELSSLGHQVQVAALHSAYDELEDKHLQLDDAEVTYVAPMHVRKQGSLKSYYSNKELIGITIRATWQLTRAALASDADIIHVGKPHPMNSLAGLATSTLRGRRLFLDCDDYEAGVGHFRSNWQKRGVVYFEDHMPFHVQHITTNTFFTRQRLIDLGVAADKISYISNGIDRRRFASPDPAAVAELRHELGLEGRQVVAFVGSLSRPGHPVDLLFQAFTQVHQRAPNSVLLLVGGGDDYPRLQVQSQEMGLQNSMIFCGRVPANRVVQYYHLADVSVDPVLDDGAARGRSPLKLFESWACGVPFVTCDVGDRRFLLGSTSSDNGSAGLLARPGDPDSLAEEILRVLQDARLAQALARRGLERAQDYYWDVLVKELENLYIRN
jgi:glycosyltransferase involved in cell wall biosynthesis